MTHPNADGSFGCNRDFPKDISLSGKPHQFANLRRRDFLIRFCQGVGATLIPSRLWGLPLPGVEAARGREVPGARFHLKPHYRSDRPLDATLLKVQAGSDEFVTEKYAEQVGAVLAEWSEELLKSPGTTKAMVKALADDFTGASPRPAESRVVRPGQTIQVHGRKFSSQASLSRDAFLREWGEALAGLSEIVTAEFQITSIEAKERDAAFIEVRTSVRYEIVGAGSGFHREQRIGNWEMTWELAPTGAARLLRWSTHDETQARSLSPVYADITAAALGSNMSHETQLLHGTDYWRSVLDGACGIDVYGHNGVSIADIDGDGLDDLYVCQPAGIPNRLYRNRGDGTFEDVTDASGLGILENTTCALFADFRNGGRQDAIVVCASGPKLFLNDGRGKFREKADAFQFATPPQGAFTGAAVADYDHDGWLDIYFCLYNYYQGTGQYRYPIPYHDAENGPPNFLMRNRGDGTFLDVTAASGLDRNNTRYSFCCGWNDYNGDGWPDLYVVNDFGRKNLYRNKGDGTFTDVAPQAKAEDIGAGMSVSWADYDNDGSPDLYVANMWTAAGERVSTQRNFKSDSASEVRWQYQKHAMGNSLLLNRGAAFQDTTASAGVGVGRWAWSSDGFDFDHDGFPDLYVANGMVSGPMRNDLNSFFWRQVVARSPDDARATHDYEQGWNAINELIRSDGTWSGYERNVFYVNNRDGTFSDVSGAVGLDFVEDGRAFAIGDLDHDGRVEIVLKNRNAPQLRILKNVMRDLPASIAFRLQGTKSNRDGIGAVVTIETSAGKQARSLQAGSGFLSQHSKEMVFGLGEAKGTVRASIRWPSGAVQELRDLAPNHRIWVEEGSDARRSEPFLPTTHAPAQVEVQRTGEKLPDQIETWLLAPIAAPEFSLPDSSGKLHSLSEFRGRPVLLNLWSVGWAHEGAKKFLADVPRLAREGLRGIVVNLNGEETPAGTQLQNLPWAVVRGSDDFAAVYNILYRQIFDRHRDMTLPTAFLVDAAGLIVKVYQGSAVAEHVEYDFQHIPTTDAERLARALPFPSNEHTLAFGRNHLSLGALFFQRGYLDQAEASFEQALRDDPSNAEALYGIGSVYMNQNKNAAARDAFERTVKLPANYPNTLPDAWNNLGVIATREGKMDEAVRDLQQALRISPDHLLSLTNLGNAYRAQQQWDEARKVLERAVKIAPDDPEANYGLGMVFAQTGDNAQAYERLQSALKARPAYPEALNNLGVLYLVTHRRDDAVASFQQCIRVAPAFDQAYLNLARVFALDGDRDKARNLLVELLQQHPDHERAKQMLEQLK